MKRLFFVLGLLFAGVAVNAQTAQTTTQSTEQTPQQKAHIQAMRMQKNLTLSAEQTTQVEAVLLAKIEAIDKVKNDASKTPDAKKAEIEKIKADKDQELSTILTPAQYTQYTEMKTKQKDRSAAANGGSGE
jgi:hypothetical protein